MNKKTYLLGILFLLLCSIPSSCSDDENVEIVVQSIKLNVSNFVLNIGDVKQLEVEIKPDNASNKEVSWTSSSPEIVSVAQDGKISALATGKAIIKAMAGDQNAQCEITVVKAIESITLDLTDLKLTVGETGQLKATILPGDVTNPELSWSSEDPTIASVAAGLVTALKAGNTIVYAQCGEVKASCHVTVVEKPAAFHPFSLFAEYNVGVTPNTFASSHNTEDIGFFNFTDAQPVCPDGYHLPQEAEFYSVVGNQTTYITFNGKSDAQNVDESIYVDGEIQNFKADYYTTVKNLCYGIKFKDNSGKYLSAYRWEYDKPDSLFIVKCRWLKGENKNLEITDIANEEYWNSSDENEIIRIFPAVGYKYKAGSSAGVGTISYYWSSDGNETKGILMYFLAGNYALTGNIGSSLLCNVRCVKNTN